MSAFTDRLPRAAAALYENVRLKLARAPKRRFAAVEHGSRGSRAQSIRGFEHELLLRWAFEKQYPLKYVFIFGHFISYRFIFEADRKKSAIFGDK